MKFDFVEWDSGRMRVNAQFHALLKQNGLDSFESVMNCDRGDVVRAIDTRVTTRIVLDDQATPRTFYLKRHSALPLRARLKPWLHLATGVFGAKPEFEAILNFHAASLPTVTPVAFGEAGAESWLITEGLDSSRSLLDWSRYYAQHRTSTKDIASEFKADQRELRQFTTELARISRRMHDTGLHHQDFYLNHILWCPKDEEGGELRVIDLGRVRVRNSVGLRWILKDLSQLNFSARDLPCTARLRFLREYLGRPLRRADRKLIWWLQLKSAAIARHTLKHNY